MTHPRQRPRRGKGPAVQDGAGAPTASIPAQYVERYREIVARTDALCDARLNTEYKTLCRKMAGAICQKGSPVLGGTADGWAAGVVYALGRVNFLSDPDRRPYMTGADIAAACQASQATMMKRARDLREALGLLPLHPEWCLPSRLGDNPLIWMLEIDGFLIDLRQAPREVQVEAFEQGLIPYVPADRERAGES